MYVYVYMYMINVYDTYMYISIGLYTYSYIDVCKWYICTYKSKCIHMDITIIFIIICVCGDRGFPKGNHRCENSTSHKDSM